jgi:hypothetical protein
MMEQGRRRAGLINLAGKIDAVYCISLVARADRRKEFKAAMAGVGLGDRVQFLIEEPFLDTLQRSRGAMNDRQERVKAADMGCALSHRRAVELAKRRGYRNILVFEDDAIPSDRFDPERIARAVDELETVEGDLFTLGCCKPDWRPGTPKMITGKPVEGHEEIVIVRNAVTTHAIMYNARAFDRLLLWLPTKAELVTGFSNVVMLGAYDQWLFDASSCYAMLHEQFLQSGSTSDIIGMGHQTDIIKMITETHEELRKAVGKETVSR